MRLSIFSCSLLLSLFFGPLSAVDRPDSPKGSELPDGSIPKVLIIGIDGCRPDALLAAETPYMDRLWKNGAYTFTARTDEISSSGPAWSAMLTGVWHQKHKDVDVMFVQLDEVDGAGHRHDYSPESKKYLKAIERCDTQVAKMVSALEKRPSYKNENWLIILSADHGGSDFGHGKNIPEHTTVFYVAAGPSVAKGEIKQDVGVVDVAVTALYHLGIPAKPEWDLDGRVAGLK